MTLQLRIRDVATWFIWCCNYKFVILQMLHSLNVAAGVLLGCYRSMLGPNVGRPGASKPQYFCKLGKKMPNLINPLAHSLMEIGKHRQTMKKTDRRTWRRQAHVIRAAHTASPCYMWSWDKDCNIEEGFARTVQGLLTSKYSNQDMAQHIPAPQVVTNESGRYADWDHRMSHSMLSSKFSETSKFSKWYFGYTHLVEE